MSGKLSFNQLVLSSAEILERLCLGLPQNEKEQIFFMAAYVRVNPVRRLTELFSTLEGLIDSEALKGHFSSVGLPSSLLPRFACTTDTLLALLSRISDSDIYLNRAAADLIQHRHDNNRAAVSFVDRSYSRTEICFVIDFLVAGQNFEALARFVRNELSYDLPESSANPLYLMADLLTQTPRPWLASEKRSVFSEAPRSDRLQQFSLAEFFSDKRLGSGLKQFSNGDYYGPDSTARDRIHAFDLSESARPCTGIAISDQLGGKLTLSLLFEISQLPSPYSYWPGELRFVFLGKQKLEVEFITSRFLTSSALAVSNITIESLTVLIKKLLHEVDLSAEIIHGLYYAVAHVYRSDLSPFLSTFRCLIDHYFTADASDADLNFIIHLIDNCDDEGFMAEMKEIREQSHERLIYRELDRWRAQLICPESNLDERQSAWRGIVLLCFTHNFQATLRVIIEEETGVLLPLEAGRSAERSMNNTVFLQLLHRVLPVERSLHTVRSRDALSIARAVFSTRERPISGCASLRNPEVL